MVSSAALHTHASSLVARLRSVNDESAEAREPTRLERAIDLRAVAEHEYLSALAEAMTPAQPSPAIAPGELLTVVQAAQRLSIGTSTLRAVIARREIEVIRKGESGRWIRITVAEVERYLATLKTTRRE